MERQKTQNKQHNTEGGKPSQMTDTAKLQSHYKLFIIIKMVYDIGKRIDKSINGTGQRTQIGLQKYSQLIFDKGAKAIVLREDSLFNKWCRNNRTSTCKK